ncbi:MAG: PKD domain-containing protein, partial [Bacteroidota bacterium]
SIRVLFLLFVLGNLSVFNSYGQVDDEFWFVAPEVNDEHGNNPDQGEPTYLRISTDSLAAGVKIYQPGKGNDPIYEIDNIPPFSTRSIKFRLDGTGDLDLGDVENELHGYTGELGNISQKGLKIESTTDITAYYEIAASYNREIISLKGDNALGKEFYVPFQTKFSTDTRYNLLYSAIDIVATESNTEVTVDPTESILLINSSGQVEHTGPITKTLDKGETFSVVPYGTGDNTPWDISRSKRLDGTKVTSTKPIAVQTKDDLVNPPGGVDYVSDQLVPVTNLGTEYIVNRGKLDSGQEWAYVLATDDNTEIFKDGSSLGTINAGETLPVEIDNSAVRISSADSSVYVYHVSGIFTGLPSDGGEGNQVGGAIVPTVSECTGSTVVPFVRTSSHPFYMNLLVRDGAEDDFILNGDPTLITAGDFTDLPGPWSVATINLTSDIPTGDQSIIKNTEDVFHMGILNGETDCYYGYFSEFQQVEANVNMSGWPGSVAKLCYGDELQLWAKGATIYTWEARSSPSYLSNPTSRFPTVDPPEDKEYRVILEGFCSLKDTSEWGLVEVAEPLVSDLITDASSGCSPFEIMLQDSSVGVNYEYRYDFGDGTTLDTADVTSGDTIRHTYENTSDTVENPHLELVVENKSHCKDTFLTDFAVYPEITSAFEPDTIGCSPFEVEFQNNSDGDTSDYRWKFGDGSTSKEFEPTHTFTNHGNSDSIFEVSLISTASNNICKDTAFRQVEVHPHVKADYTIDKIEGCSPFDVIIENTSVGEDSLVFTLGNGKDTTFNSVDSVEYQYSNNSTTPDTNYLYLEVWNEAKCKSVADTTVIIVHPEIRAEIEPYDTIGCNEIEVGFDNTTNIPASDFSWNFGDGTSSSDSVPTHTFTNGTNADTSYTVEFHAESDYGCYDDTTATVHVNRAKANFDIDKSEGCSPLNVQIDNKSKGSGLDYTWNYGDGSPEDNDTDPVSHEYVNDAGGADTSTLELIVEGSGSCADTMTREIVTYSSVDADYDITSEDEFCSPDTVEFENQSSGWASDFDWNFGDGTGSSASGTVSHEYSYSGITDTSYNVSLEVSTPYGCSDTIQYDDAVTVHPSVNAGFSMDVVEACSPVTVDLSADENPAIGGYDWDFDNGNIPSGQNPPEQTYTNISGNPDTNTIQLAVEGSSGFCTDTIEKDLVVFSEVIADFTPDEDTSGCNPLEVQFSEAASSWADKFRWDFNGSSSSNAEEPDYEFVNNSEDEKDFYVNLEVETENGCTHDTTRIVTVHPFIEAAFSMDQYEGCSPLTVDAEAEEYGGIGDYQWDFDNGNTPTGWNPGEQTYNKSDGGSDSYTVQLTVTDKTGNCTDDTTRDITVWSSINADFSVVDSSYGCNPLTVDFTDESDDWADSWNWKFGDGSSSGSQNPEHEFQNPATDDTTYLVELIAETEHGCSDNNEMEIDVYSYLQADFTITDNEGCPPFTTTFENHSVGHPDNNYEWQIDGAPVSEAPTDKSDFTHEFENNTPNIQEHEIKLIARNEHGCTSVYKDTVRVYQNVEASFDFSSPSEGCNPLTVDFSDLSTVPPGTLYNWDFGDGASSSQENPEHKYYNYDNQVDEEFEVTLTVSSPFYCSDDTSATIEVFHQPEAEFDIDETASCPPLEPTMENESVGHSSFEWRFGDNSTNTVDNEVTYQYSNDSNAVKPYYLELYVESEENCKDSTGLTLNVYPNVIADFTFENGDADCHPFVAELKDSSLNADSYYWEFGDGNTSGQEAPVHRFTNLNSQDTTYPVFLRASSEYDCWDTITKPLTVYAQPDVEFQAEPQVQKFPESRVFLTNKSNEGPWSYHWSFDDGSSANEESPHYHDYEHWGNYDIGLGIRSNTSHCNDTMTKSISILPPQVDASYQLSRDDGCEPLTVDFEGASSEYDEEYAYSWDFGDGNEGEGQNTTHTFDSAGTYYVKMVAEGEGGTDHAYDTIQVYKNPIPDFEIEPKLVMLPDQKMHCFNLSEFGENYLWDFGDGSTDTSRNPKHLYTELGEFDVSLTVETEKGCVDSIVKEDVVEVKGEKQLKFPNAFTPSKSGPSDGTWSENEQDNNIFHPVGAGVVEYKLEIFNKWGEKLFESTDFQVGWDGYYQGELVAQDVYVWKVEAKFSNGEVVEKMGDVTVLR